MKRGPTAVTVEAVPGEKPLRGSASRLPARSSREGEVDVVLLGGAHSDYDPEIIQRLSSLGRLFGGGNINGVIPGESAAFLLLTTPGFARAKELLLAHGSTAWARASRRQGPTTTSRRPKRWASPWRSRRRPPAWSRQPARRLDAQRHDRGDPPTIRVAGAVHPSAAVPRASAMGSTRTRTSWVAWELPRFLSRWPSRPPPGATASGRTLLRSPWSAAIRANAWRLSGRTRRVDRRRLASWGTSRVASEAVCL